MDAETLLENKLRTYLYECKATVKDGVVKEIAKYCVEEWELDTAKEVEDLEFDYFPLEEDDEDDDSPEVWVYNGFCDISFDLNTGESTGSGRGIL